MARLGAAQRCGAVAAEGRPTHILPGIRIREHVQERAIELLRPIVRPVTGADCECGEESGVGRRGDGRRGGERA